ETPVDVFQCPSDAVAGAEPLASSYRGVQGGYQSPDGYDCGTAERRFYVNGALYVNSKIGFRDLVDGSSNTLLIGESHYSTTRVNSSNGAYVGWASSPNVNNGSRHAINLAAADNGINSAPVDPLVDDPRNYQSHTFGSFHPGGCQFVMADGSVHFIGETVDITMFRGLGIRNDGLPVGGFQE
ncbi:MAG: DUF1559 domain-containing protein, partial [Blastopirellula sp. JB062]